MPHIFFFIMVEDNWWRNQLDLPWGLHFPVRDSRSFSFWGWKEIFKFIGIKIFSSYEMPEMH